jgi:cation transport ATPase
VNDPEGILSRIKAQQQLFFSMVESAGDKATTEAGTLEVIAKASTSEIKDKAEDDQKDKPHHEQDVALAEQEKKAYTKMKDAEVECKQAEAAQLHAQTKTENTRTEIMQWIAKETFFFMKCWCGFVGLMTWMYFSTKQGQVEKEVMIALLGTTTISIVGLVGFIVKGLFGSKDEKPSKDKK